MDEAIVLQSGFLTFLTDEINNDFVYNNDPSLNNIVQAVKLNRIIIDKSNFFYNTKIDELVKEYSVNNKSLMDFDYRERLLKVAKYIFGTTSFYDWCTLQTKSKYLTATHKKFIIESLTFMTTGYRSTSVSMWSRLLDIKLATDEDDKVPYNYSDFFIHKGNTVIEKDIEYRNNNNSCDLEKESVINMIVLWTGQNEGFQDLLFFLDTIFGKKQ